MASIPSIGQRFALDQSVTYIRTLYSDGYLSAVDQSSALKHLDAIAATQHPIHRKERMYWQEISLVVNHQIRKQRTIPKVGQEVTYYPLCD